MKPLPSLPLSRQATPPNTLIVFVLMLCILGGHGHSRGESHHGHLNLGSYWYSWLDFAPDRVDPSLARQMLDDLVSDRGQERLEDEAVEAARHLGIDTAAPGFDWREHIHLRWEPHVSSYFTTSQPPVSEDWMNPDFDPQAVGWALRPRPAQTGVPTRSRAGRGATTVEPASMMVRAAYHRTTFEMDEPRDLALNLTYRGGIRVFVNGEEILRRHLPEGVLHADTPAEGYSQAVGGEQFTGNGNIDPGDWLNREIEDFIVPARLLRAGSNLLAVENRAPFLHPEAVRYPRAHGILGSRRRDYVILPPHASILRLHLSPRGTSVESLAELQNRHRRGRHRDAAGPSPQRPPGVQVWAGDIHQRYHDIDFIPAGVAPGAIRIAAARNGVFNGMVVVGTEHELTGVGVRVSDLRSGEGGAVLPADRIHVRGMRGSPVDDDLLRTLGRHRGRASLGGNHTVFSIQSEYRYGGFVRQPGEFFDRITDAPPERIAADRCQPFWLEVSIPAEFPPGLYRGEVRVSADGGEPRTLPLLVAVADWRLPDARESQVFTWIEQSPYGLATWAGVDLWTDAHWQLIESSFGHLARIGADLVHIPVLQRSEFGNVDDAMVRWSGDPATDNVELDFSLMDRYLDIVARTIGQPRVLSVNIMQGAGGGERGRGHDVMENVTTVPFSGREDGVDLTERRHLYEILAREVVARMRARGWEDSLFWGHFWDTPPQPELFDEMAGHAPDVFWTRAGHIAGGIPDRLRVQSEVFPSRWARGERPGGAIVALNPRRHSPTHNLEGYYPPFSFRLLPERAVYSGYDGFGRMGADYGEQWGEGNNIRGGVPYFGTYNLLWADPDGVDAGQRFEILREGKQEAEAMRFLKLALDSGELPDDLARRVAELLDRRIGETSYVPAYFFHFNSVVLHDHPQGWQRRSWQLFQAAAEVAQAMDRSDPGRRPGLR